MSVCLSVCLQSAFCTNQYLIQDESAKYPINEKIAKIDTSFMTKTAEKSHSFVPHIQVHIQAYINLGDIRFI